MLASSSGSSSLAAAITSNICLKQTLTSVCFRLHWLQALCLLAWKCIVSNLTLDSTHMMWHGSFLSFRQYPASHFFFVGNVVLIYFDPACVFLIEHHGASEKHTKLLMHKKLFNLIVLELIFIFLYLPQEADLYNITVIQAKMWCPHLHL